MDKRVEIELGAKGANKAASDVDKVSDSVDKLNKKSQQGSSSAQQMGSAIGDFAKRAAPAALAAAAVVDVLGAGYKIAKEWNEAGRDMRPINFGKAADEFRAYDDRVTRFAVSVGANAETLRTKFERVGAQVGVMPSKLAETAANLSRMTGTEASDAMRDLAVEANDSNRSLEEMAAIGATMHNQLGVPISKIGEELRRAKGIADEFGHAGGHVALEDSLSRLAGLFAKIQGGAKYASLALAVLGQGTSKEVAERSVQTIISSFVGADPLKHINLYRSLKKDKLADPYEKGPTGEEQLKTEYLDLAYDYFKRTKSYGQALRFFGNDPTSTRVFLEQWPKLRAAQKEQSQREAEQNRITETYARLKTEYAQADGFGSSEQIALEALLAKRYRQTQFVAPGGFAATAAGARAQTEVEKTNVQLQAGENRQLARDASDALYQGNRELQQAVIKAGSESHVIGAVRAVGETALTSGVTAPVPVRLDDATIKRLAPTPPISPAAAAVESNRGTARRAANY